MSHLEALASLYPLEQDEEQKAMMEIEAGILDDFQSGVSTIENDIFPDTTSKLAKMEQALGLDSRGTVEDRIKAVVAKRAASGGISRPFFRDLAAVLGYAIEFGEQERPFRVGFSQIGDQLWSLDGPESPWRWTVVVVGLGPNTDMAMLQSIFDDLKPAYTGPNFILERTIDQGDGEILNPVFTIDQGDGELLEVFQNYDEGDGLVVS